MIRLPGSLVKPSSAPLDRPSHVRRAVGAALAFAAVATSAAFASVVPAVAAGSESATSTPWTVSVSETTDLVDGQRIKVNLKAPSDVSIYGVQIQVCRLGVAYQPSSGSRPNTDFNEGSPNCPNQAISSSGDKRVIPTDLTSAKDPEGATYGYTVGSGRVVWENGGQNYDLSCDGGHPCALVVQVRGTGPGQPTTWIPTIFELSYRSSDPLAGCGGAAAGALKSQGSERIEESWIHWTRSSCQRPGATGALTSAIFPGDGRALTDYVSGRADVTYTSLGFTEGTGFIDAGVSGGATERPSIATPLAVNATVIAVANWYPGPSGRKLPYSDIKLTADEAAALIGGGPYGVGPHLQDIYARNPQLAASGMFDTNSAIQVTAPAEREGTTWLLTRYLSDLAPEGWMVPNNAAIFGDDAGKPRVVNSSFGTARPAYTRALEPYTSRSVLRSRLYNSIGPGGLWVVTDYATAKQLDLHPVAIENADGAFVQPTDDTLRAATDTIDLADPNPWVPGTDLTASSAAAAGRAPTAGVDPYPLTFVEYALAPAEPLRNDDCTPRTASQEILTSWLRYVTGEAQAELADGLIALTPALAEQAAERIAAVGASETTGPCAGWTPESELVPTPPVDDGSRPDPVSSLGAAFGGAGAVPALLAGVGPGAGAAAAATALPGDLALAGLPTDVVQASAGGPRPGYGGAEAASIVLTVGSFLAIATTSAIAAYRTSGRRRAGRSKPGVSP